MYPVPGCPEIIKINLNRKFYTLVIPLSAKLNLDKGSDTQTQTAALQIDSNDYCHVCF